jgi:phosphoribosyl-AMP cyclohydrolase
MNENRTPGRDMGPTAIPLTYDDRGLIPAVLQDATTGEILMMAWMNEEALQLTLETREAHFWSRSRQMLWHKGATSGNVQRVTEIWVDCDADVLLLKVEPAGPACHTGERSCFYRRLWPRDERVAMSDTEARDRKGWMR